MNEKVDYELTIGSYVVTDNPKVFWEFPRTKSDNPVVQLSLNTTSDYFIKNREAIEKKLGTKIKEYLSTGTFVDGKKQSYSQAITTDLKDETDAEIIELYELCGGESVVPIELEATLKRIRDEIYRRRKDSAYKPILDKGVI